jgi:hypothetical protein
MAATRGPASSLPMCIQLLEGSKVSGTSKEAEIKLTGVARASLEELLIEGSS